MHELSIATGLIEQVTAAAIENGVDRVEVLEITIGAMRQVVPEALAMAFEVVSEGTVAEGATLEIVEEPIHAHCRECDEEFACQVGEFVCPHCGQADVRLTMGADIILTSMTCTKVDGASTE